MGDNKQKGELGENLAHLDYVRRGFETVARNYRCVWGEIDLIMKNASFLVFCEVKLRRSELFGGAVWAITLAKRRKLIKSALMFISENPVEENIQLRFDVFCVQIGQKNDKIWVKSTQLIENAFEVKEDTYI